MNLLQEADKLTSLDRQGSYGHPFSDFSKTANFWTELFKGKLLPGAVITPHEVGLAMVFLKLSREIHKHKDDNLIDAAGYLRTTEMCLEKQNENANTQQPGPNNVPPSINVL